MSQRYVLNAVNLNNLNNISRNADTSFNKTEISTPNKKDLRQSMHSISKTKTPTRLSSRVSKDININRMVPLEKYEQLVVHYNDLAKAQKLLKLQRDQFSKGYNQLKFISEREKTQLCQAFEQLKANYIQMQNKCQSFVQQSKRTPSSIEKLYSQIQETPPASSIYTIKEQYYAALQQNKNMKSHMDMLQRELSNTRLSLDKVSKQKYELAIKLQTVYNDVKVRGNDTKNKSEQTVRQQLHQQSQQRYVLGLTSQKNINPEISKVSLLLQENTNLILWKQNIQNYYINQLKNYDIHVEALTNQVQKQQECIDKKDKLISNLQTHLEAMTNQNQRIQEKSRIVEEEMGKVRNQAIEVKQKASEEYKQKIAQILDKAFHLSSNN